MKAQPRIIAAVVLLALIAGIAAQEAAKGPAPGQIVLKQLEAFNRHDPEALARGVTEDFKWFNVTSDATTIETQSREKFLAGMKGYFRSFPTVTSKIEGMAEAGPFVSFRETASWTNKNGLQHQSSIGVYEIRGGLITRAWYYPASK